MAACTNNQRQATTWLLLENLLHLSVTYFLLQVSDTRRTNSPTTSRNSITVRNRRQPETASNRAATEQEKQTDSKQTDSNRTSAATELLKNQRRHLNRGATRASAREVTSDAGMRRRAGRDDGGGGQARVHARVPVHRRVLALDHLYATGRRRHGLRQR